jgi:hypothetical protein
VVEKEKEMELQQLPYMENPGKAGTGGNQQAKWHWLRKFLDS